MNRSRAALAAIAIVVVIVATAGYAWLRPSLAAARQGKHVRENAERAAANVSPQWRKDTDAVLADDALWATLLPKRERDASAYLAKILPADRSAAPRLPQAAVDAVTVDAFAWHADQVPLEGVDTSWLRPLPGFTHWDIDAHQANADESALFAEHADVVPLLHWGRVRLVEGIARGEEQAASDEVRALARLLWSTDQLLSGAVAARLIADDASAREVAHGLGVSFSTPDIATAQKLEKVVLSESMLFNVITPKSLARYEAGDARFCGALGDGAASFLLGGDTFARHEDRKASIADAIAKSPCALTRVRRQWQGHGGRAVEDARDLRTWVAHRFLEDAFIAAVAMPPRGYFADIGDGDDGE